ncbi:MAG: hypothetical protein N0C88_02010 [Candidatus Thiodiazotropha lotti]|uniref:Uncharacterized protein n=1 Tax=Candidatus Thiodiazotropha lotti TaxID=2792787 RepID=A0A9E4K271_9GAMM|nr:hypothetical protein [Candidatus Thiodiazotropha endoloripes]MCG7937618.1 hypothetical protein [Candidatus Thiodiazotropha lotti]MCG8001827.1 hypothetical protein [Candidatus Thiodiazotropha lotti]MCW4185445.1 hypothetical protein [Candidatus Thiodiazotropha lotti]MCW4202084.1 hypothetical protein [Candidatus Thiodiazotropha lotti]ODB94152.1 hypothetical protein A3194_05740 [Candidatus Thiodiazotropha endoloripes]
MPEKEGNIKYDSDRILNDILCELKNNNELLESLLVVQGNIQSRQKKFWLMALAQVALIVVVLAWWSSKYGI